jgi:hypothetical protein
MMTLKEAKINQTLEIHVGGKKVNVNLSKELAINENIINSQLKESPSSYSYLCSLRDRYIKQRDSLEREKDMAYSEAWIYYKESNDRMTNDMASHKANINRKYTSVLERYQRILYKANRLISICKAFENRERILQSINANIRKQQ